MDDHTKEEREDGDRIAELEITLASTRKICRMANENAIAWQAEAEKWKGIQQQACSQRDALRKAGDALAEYLAPGPIPSQEPTEVDYLLADWEQAASQCLTRLAEKEGNL